MEQTPTLKTIRSTRHSLFVILRGLLETQEIMAVDGDMPDTILTSRINRVATLIGRPHIERFMTAALEHEKDLRNG